MVDLNLASRSALAPFIKLGHFGATDVEPGVMLREIVDFGLVSLTAYKGQGKALSEVIQAQLGLPLPEARKVSRRDGLSIISTAPNQWLVFAEWEMAEDLYGTLVALANPFAAVVDQSHARAVIDVSGARAREALAKGISLDLHPKAFQTGESATTLASQLWITMWQTNDLPTYRLSIFRGFGESLLNWLVSSANEFGCKIIGQ